MLKRIVGTIIIKNGWAVQSFGYSKHLPLGRPEILARNLDQWQLDEIMIIDVDASKRNKGPNLSVLQDVMKQRITTPLSYVGGIRNSIDAVEVIASGADRIGVETLNLSDFDEVRSISDSIGRQALIRIQPLILDYKGEVKKYNFHEPEATKQLDTSDLFASSVYSELMIVDVKNEGIRNGFDQNLLKPFEAGDTQLICFGGITEKHQVTVLFNKLFVSAIAMGNALSWRELAHRELLEVDTVRKVREISYGNLTKGEREW